MTLNVECIVVRKKKGKCPNYFYNIGLDGEPRFTATRGTAKVFTDRSAALQERAKFDPELKAECRVMFL
jgi:hypothetical protein